MSSLSDDTLRKILIQIQQTAIQAKRALDVSQQQTQVKERERRILQLTIDEITQIPGDVNTYKGVGKMFMMVPRTDMEKELKNQEKELSDDITGLSKKASLAVEVNPCEAYSLSAPAYQSKYLEKQFNDAQSQLRDIFHNAPKAP